MDKITLILVLIGLTAGLASGFFGIGGGVLVVPALIALLGYSLTRATGTSLVVLLPPVGLGAVLEYSRRGQVDWRAAVIVAASLFVGATVGAVAANRLAGPALKMAFGLFVVAVGLHIAWTSLPGRDRMHGTLLAPGSVPDHGKKPGP